MPLHIAPRPVGLWHRVPLMNFAMQQHLAVIAWLSRIGESLRNAVVAV
jgi:hypothetical protein